ncbi:hypothetical protein PHYC_03392 [Phycisphaerales bacterium]|nr:hypothetical protein PHYC_03392 [Phycisphaerales bacterium]
MARRARDTPDVLNKIAPRGGDGAFPFMNRSTLLVATLLFCGVSFARNGVPPGVEAVSVARLNGNCAPATSEIVDSVVVHSEGASWMRLHFGSSHLPGDPGAGDACVIRITSLLDQAEQSLTSEHVAQWANSSAYFNGDSVRVDLLSRGAPGPAFLEILSVELGSPPAPEQYGERTICGPTDDRLLSADPAVARLFPTICTAWIINDPNRTMLSAGHCSVGAGSVVEFNVPLSNSDGTIVHPPPQDQYAVEPTSVQSRFNGIGDDWAYFGCFPNSQTGLTAAQAQGSFFELAENVPAAEGQAVGVTGFGAVYTPIVRTWQYVQKSHVGAFSAMEGLAVRHTVDTTGGNSGSPVYLAADRRAIAIHTNAGCTASGGSNSATAVNNPNLRFALAHPAGVCASGLGAVSGVIAAAGDLNNHVGLVDDQSGRFGAVAQTPPGMQGLAYDPTRRQWVAIDESRTLWVISYPFGQAVPIGPLVPDPGLITGLAVDPIRDRVYGVRAADGQLFEINLITRIASAVGAPFGGIIGGLDADPQSGTLFALDDSPSGTRLLRFNNQSNAWLIIGMLGSGASDCNALAATTDGRLFTINAANATLLRVDPGTGAATVIGPTGALFGSAFGMSGAPPIDPCPVVDFNDDGAINGYDLETLEQIINGFEDRPDADVNQDGALNGFDLEAYEQRINGGC